MKIDRHGNIAEIEPNSVAAFTEAYMTEDDPDPERNMQAMVAEFAGMLDTGEGQGPKPTLDWEPTEQDLLLGRIEAAMFELA